jgi:hypothetical protein
MPTDGHQRCEVAEFAAVQALLKSRSPALKSELLRTLVAASGAKTAGFGVPSPAPKWRARRDSNSRPSDSKFGLPEPTGH